MKTPDNTILIVEVGSTAHGTGIEGQEDHDETAVVIESAEQVLIKSKELKNVMQRTKPEGERSGPGDTDRQVYPLRNFIDLAVQGNPSILVALWSPVLWSTAAGRELRTIAPSFVGRHIIPKFRGYASGQALRLLGLKGNGHGRRGGGGREELIAEYGYDTKYAMHCARLGYQCIELLTQRHLQFPIPGSIGDNLRDIRYGKVSFQEWWELVLMLDYRMESMLDSEDLPEGPNTEFIYKWSVKTHRDYWGHLIT